MLPPEKRLTRAQLDRYISHQLYWVLHASRQAGPQGNRCGGAEKPGLFEAAGIAMIIGAYVTGLSPADTDIAYLVQEKIETVHQLFDPIFFTVIGMIVNVRVLFSVEAAGFGLLFGALAWASKIAGCSIPALFLGFTPQGAFRMGLGMVPRGEVALIISAIGIGAGILDSEKARDDLLSLDDPGKLIEYIMNHSNVR
jgi:Kef-type K+ transport system membrane component KefB